MDNYNDPNYQQPDDYSDLQLTDHSMELQKKLKMQTWLTIGFVAICALLFFYTFMGALTLFVA